MLRDLPEARAHHAQILVGCGNLIEAGRLRIEVARSLALEQAVEAHRQIEAGHTQGKLVLRP
jgi:NADPH2:quinone reductase